MSDLSGSNLGDFSHGDTAGGNIYHITASIDALIELLQENLVRTEARVTRLEEIGALHAQERQSLMRALMLLANESTSVQAVQRQLDEQLAAERAERAGRRRQLDTILYCLAGLTAISIGLQVFRRPQMARPRLSKAA